MLNFYLGEYKMPVNFAESYFISQCSNTIIKPSKLHSNIV